MLPIIMAAPHAANEIKDEEMRSRIALTDEQIWKCSDPFTGDLRHFTCATYKHVAKTNRLVCDFNRAPNVYDAFRDKDFFSRSVFKDEQEFSFCEKEMLLMKYWHPFHEEIVDSIKKLDEEGHEVILLVDYHNTAGDHALNQEHEYMPSFILSNLGLEYTAKKDQHHPVISMDPEYVVYLRDFIYSELQVAVEVNTIYHGGYDLSWFSHLQNILKTNAKIFSIQIEYNLDYIFNPISKALDKKALDIMQKTLNEGLISLYETIAAKEAAKK